MLPVFELVAKDIQDKDEYALVPFYRFYAIVEKDLDHQVRIDKLVDDNDEINII